MAQPKLTELTDEALLKEAKRMRTASIINALLIGLLIGIVIYSVAKNGFGFFILIPLFFAYKLVINSAYNYKEVLAVLKERNLRP